jgi:hypothetical protein
MIIIFLWKYTHCKIYTFIAKLMLIAFSTNRYNSGPNSDGWSSFYCVCKAIIFANECEKIKEKIYWEKLITLHRDFLF